MVMSTPQGEIHTLHLVKELDIAAPVDTTWAALLAELGPESMMPGDVPFPMKLEPWVGGRWYRDLGDGVAHLWAYVQVIKPPTLLELWGPLFMSAAALAHVQYRLAPISGGTRLKLTNQALGMMTEEHRLGVDEGWEFNVQRVRAIAERTSR